jgi:hypothetical protein
MPDLSLVFLPISVAWRAVRHRQGRQALMPALPACQSAKTLQFRLMSSLKQAAVPSIISGRRLR